MVLASSGQEARDAAKKISWYLEWPLRQDHLASNGHSTEAEKPYSYLC